ncbi:MAG: CBS domain-containing protein [Deltaproteobacteria bacterium RBG_13_49_15]|nr:MAG: CBS domain-containing protein [Deltaproteobacteria bacterium RBG_13_49_15]
MFVSESMAKKVITIDQESNILFARELMKQNQIRHLPVVEKNGRLIGIITDRDLRSALPSLLLYDSREEKEKLSRIKVKDIMTKDPITVLPTYTIQDVLLLIQKARVGALPVVNENGILKGIIGVRDMLRAFINVLGIGEPGTLLCILVEDRIGTMKRIVDAITEEGISFGSILVARYWDKGKRAVFPYLLTQDVSRVKKKLQQKGFTLLDPMEWYLDQLPGNE